MIVVRGDGCESVVLIVDRIVGTDVESGTVLAASVESSKLKRWQIGEWRLVLVSYRVS